MKKFATVKIAAALLLAGSSMAFGATVKARITFVDAAGHQVTLDNNDIYALGPNVDVSGVGPGSLVQATTGGPGGRTITAIKKL